MSNEIVRPDFSTMPIGKLREYASHMQLPLAKTATKEEIRQAIERKLAGRSAAVLATKMARFHPAMLRLSSTKIQHPVVRTFLSI